MLELIWNDFLYRPVFNFLIFIYNNWTDQNMGWAIISLTVVLRLGLLPLTILSEMSKSKNEKLEKDLMKLQKEFSYDPVLQKQEVRRALKKRKVKPWAKTVSLGIQALVFVLLYQVFIQGITGDRMAKMLYAAVDFPGNINNMFYGFDLLQIHDLVWSGAVGLFLAAEIYFDFRKHKSVLGRPDMFYFVLFPLSVFIFLWALPLVKSLFVLTSVLFGFIVHRIIHLFVPKPKEKTT